MKVLALSHDVPGVEDSRFTTELLEAEARKAWELHQSGVLRELYFRADRQDAVLVLECASAEEAQKRLGELPLVSERLIEFEVIPLVPYPGFERLFKR